MPATASVRESEWDRVLDQRVHRFLGMGFSASQAEALALCDYVDVGEAERLARAVMEKHGDLRLAVQILL